MPRYEPRAAAVAMSCGPPDVISAWAIPNTCRARQFASLSFKTNRSNHRRGAVKTLRRLLDLIDCVYR
jgi:hypothetical protein